MCKSKWVLRICKRALIWNKTVENPKRKMQDWCDILPRILRVRFFPRRLHSSVICEWETNNWSECVKWCLFWSRPNPQTGTFLEDDIDIVKDYSTFKIFCCVFVLKCWNFRFLNRVYPINGKVPLIWLR